jgi:uncharacterized membrane protein YdjX (TVP38/TMEM64 family)
VTCESLWVLCLFLFVDGATLAATSTVLLLHCGRYHEPWQVAVAGSAASATGGALQLLALRWALGSNQPWMRRFVPSADKVDAALKAYPSASFLALTVARATPMPDLPLKIVAATVRYPIRLYTLATFLGSIPYFFALALIGHTFKFPPILLFGGFLLIAVVVLFERWRRGRRVAAVSDAGPKGGA